MLDRMFFEHDYGASSYLKYPINFEKLLVFLYLPYRKSVQLLKFPLIISYYYFNYENAPPTRC